MSYLWLQIMGVGGLRVSNLKSFVNMQKSVFIIKLIIRA